VLRHGAPGARAEDAAVPASEARRGHGAFFRGDRRGDLEDAARRVVAVQGAVAATDVFDLVHACQRQAEPVDAAHIRQVDAAVVHEDEDVQIPHLAEAARVDHALRGIARVGAHRDAEVAQQVRDVRRRCGKDRVASDDGDRRGHGEGIGVEARRRDGDGLQNEDVVLRAEEGGRRKGR